MSCVDDIYPTTFGDCVFPEFMCTTVIKQDYWQFPGFYNMEHCSSPKKQKRNNVESASQPPGWFAEVIGARTC